MFQAKRLFIEVADIAQFDLVNSRTFKHLSCFQELSRLEFRIKQDAQLSQRDRAAGCVIVFAKSRTLELGDNDLRTLGLSSTTVI